MAEAHQLHYPIHYEIQVTETLDVLKILNSERSDTVSANAIIAKKQLRDVQDALSQSLHTVSVDGIRSNSGVESSERGPSRRRRTWNLHRDPSEPTAECAGGSQREPLNYHRRWNSCAVAQVRDLGYLGSSELRRHRRSRAPAAPAQQVA